MDTCSNSRNESLFTYYANTFWQEHGDPKSSHYPFLLSGPWTLIIVVLNFLYFVKVAGPQFMKSRPPMVLTQLMAAYNFICVSLSAWMAIETALVTNFFRSSWSCEEASRIALSKSPQDDLLSRRIAFVLWVFMFSKLLEFCDTYFMVLRKKHRQISFLHVIHHASAPLSVYSLAKFAPYAYNLWFPFLNSTVHFFMYGYYGLMSLGDSLPKQFRRKLLQFKHWITLLQIIQFTLVITFVIYMMNFTDESKCKLPSVFYAVNLGNSVFFFVLFVKFYIENYCSSSSNDLHDNNKVTSQSGCNGTKSLIEKFQQQAKGKVVGSESGQSDSLENNNKVK